MNVGIDGSAWTHPGGFGRHLRELTAAMLRRPTRHRFVLFVDERVATDALPPGAKLVREPLTASADGAFRGWRQVLARSRSIGAAGIDVAVFPSLLGYVPLRLPTIVGVHDAIGHLYPVSAFGSRRSALAWRLKCRIAIARALRVVTVSERARASICATLRVDPRVVRVVGEAAAEAFGVATDPEAAGTARRAAGVPDGARLVVYHGGFARHKNLERLVRVFLRLGDSPRFNDVHLVLAGAGNDDRSTCERWLAGSRSASVPRVHICGRLTDAGLAALLNAATMAVLPSLEEGFGLTGLEAAACGAPLLATSRSAMPEVFGEAAVYFDPDDDEALGAALAGVLDDDAMRGRMRAAGLAVARGLTWERAAEQLLAVLDDVEAEVSGLR